MEEEGSPVAAWRGEEWAEVRKVGAERRKEEM
jgi:hypothetical protein